MRETNRRGDSHSLDLQGRIMREKTIREREFRERVMKESEDYMDGFGLKFSSVAAAVYVLAIKAREETVQGYYKAREGFIQAYYNALERIIQTYCKISHRENNIPDTGNDEDSTPNYHGRN